MKRSFFFLIITIFLWESLPAQKTQKMLPGEDSLISIARQISSSADDSAKLSLSIRFGQLLKDILTNSSSFAYPFDSVRILGKITSPDKKFRIYNWNMPFRDGSNRYFALMQVKEGKSYRIIELTDRSDTLPDPEHMILKPENWYGALYYKVIVMKSGQKNIYTLLGWDGFSNETSRKLIEILTFDSRGNPVFGAQVFRKSKSGKNTRIFFDYPAGTSLMLKFDEQSVPGGKRWNQSKRKYEETKETLPLIIVDHLVSVDSKAGSSEMASSDLYDGFVFRNGTWNFVTEIDARNR